METPSGKVAKYETVRAEERLKDAETLLGLAEETFRLVPNRENEITAKAARRLYRESRAQMDEWQI